MDLWQILEIAGAAVGLIYVWLEYRASIWLWLVGIIMPAIYIYVYYMSGFYAFMGINIYYILAGIYGWALWLNKRDSEGDSSRVAGESFRISRMPGRSWLPAMSLGLVFFAVIAWILINFTDSTVPYGDSFTTAYSIVGLWMLSRKYAEQWLVWMVIDLISTALCIHKGLYFTAGLYLTFSVIAVFGYIKWLKMIKEQDETIANA